MLINSTCTGMESNTVQANLDRQRHDAAIDLPATIADMLELAARKFGTAEAISFFEDGRTLTFGELDKQVRKLAHSFHGIGIRHGARVAVMLPNRIEFPLVWLALARLGAVMTPLITRLTTREIAFVLGDAAITHFVVDAQFTQLLRPLQGTASCPSSERTVTVDGHSGDGGRDFNELLENGDPDFEPDRRPPTC